MKTLQNRYGLLRFFTVLFILMSFTSVIFLPKVIIYSGYLNWLFLLMCFLLFCIPIKTPQEIYKQPLKKPFLLISLFQWSTLGIYYGLTQLSGKWLVLYTTPHQHLFLNSTRVLWIHYGFFPWPIIALFATVFARHIKEQDAYPHLLLKPLIASEADNASGLLFNALTRGTFLLIISTTIAVCGLVVAYLIAPNTLSQSLGFQPVVLICFVALFAFTVSKKTQHYWRVIATNTLIKPFMILITLVILLGLAIFIALVITAVLKIPQQENPSIIHDLLNTGWLNYWGITSLCFWLLWVLPLSLYLGDLLKTATRQKIILFTLVWPVVWTVFLALFPYSSWRPHLSTWFSTMLLLLSALLFFILISEKKMWQTTSRGYAQQVEKIRPATKLLRNIAMTTTIVLYLFWQGGVIGLSLVFVFIALPIGLLCLLSLINLGGR